MASVTLKNIQKVVSEKYVPFEVLLQDGEDGGDVVKVTLYPALRLDHDRRVELTKLQEAQKDVVDDGTGDSAVTYFKAFLKIVSQDDPNLDALFEALDEDIPTYGELISEYGEATKPGEASSSAS